jgi:hypothetical protein
MTAGPAPAIRASVNITGEPVSTDGCRRRSGALRPAATSTQGLCHVVSSVRGPAGHRHRGGTLLCRHFGVQSRVSTGIQCRSRRGQGCCANRAKNHVSVPVAPSVRQRAVCIPYCERLSSPEPRCRAETLKRSHRIERRADSEVPAVGCHKTIHVADAAPEFGHRRTSYARSYSSSASHCAGCSTAAGAPPPSAAAPGCPGPDENSAQAFSKPLRARPRQEPPRVWRLIPRPRALAARPDARQRRQRAPSQEAKVRPPHSPE